MAKNEKAVESAEKTAETKNSTKSNFFWKLSATGILPVAILAIICLLAGCNPVTFLVGLVKYSVAKLGDVGRFEAVIFLIAGVMIAESELRKVSRSSFFSGILIVGFAGIFSGLMVNALQFGSEDMGWVLYPQALILAIVYLGVTATNHLAEEESSKRLSPTFCVGVTLAIWAGFFISTGAGFLVYALAAIVVKTASYANTGLKKYWTFLKK